MAETRQIAIVLYAGLTALDALGPYEVLKMLPGAVPKSYGEPGPITADSGILTIGATHSFDEGRRLRSSSWCRAGRPIRRRPWPIGRCTHG